MTKRHAECLRSLVDARIAARTVRGMEARNDPNLATTLTFNFDQSYHWAWIEDTRSVLTAPRDQEMFDLCIAGGARLYPQKALEHLEETLHFTPDEVVDKAQWHQVIEFVDRHAQTRAPACFESFALAVEADLYRYSGQPHDRVVIDIVDACDGSAQTSTDFTVDEVLFWFGLEEEISSMTYCHDDQSSFARLSVTGPGFSRTFELHFASDAVRDYLARHHFETVVDGEDSIIPHLNAASDEHCRALYALALAHPEEEVWVLDREVADTQPQPVRLADTAQPTDSRNVRRCPSM